MMVCFAIEHAVCSGQPVDVAGIERDMGFAPQAMRSAVG